MKVKTRDIKIGGGLHYVEIHYDTKGSYFKIAKGLPSDFSTFSRKWYEKNIDSNEALLWQHLQECVREYVSNKTATRKVIVFDAHASSEIIMNRVSQGSYQGYIEPKFKKLSRANSKSTYEVGFNFGVYTELDESGKFTYYNHKLDDNFKETGEISKYNTTVENHCTVIPYTEENFQFFLGLAQGFKKMVHQLANFFGETDETKILTFIQNTPKLLS